MERFHRELNLHTALIGHIPGECCRESLGPTLPWRQDMRAYSEAEKRPPYFYHEDAERNNLPLAWNPTVQNIPCVFEKKVMCSLKETFFFPSIVALMQCEFKANNDFLRWPTRVIQRYVFQYNNIYSITTIHIFLSVENSKFQYRNIYSSTKICIPVQK